MAEKVSNTRFSHVVAPLPVINDQSLRCKGTVWGKTGLKGKMEEGRLKVKD